MTPRVLEVCKCGRPTETFSMPPFMDEPAFEYTRHADGGDPFFCYSDDRTDEVELSEETKCDRESL